MTTMTIRIDENEKELIKTYASMHGLSTAEVLRRCALERIEDEFDARELRKAMANTTGEFIDFADVLKRYSAA